MRDLETAVYNHLTITSTPLYTLVGTRIWAVLPKQAPPWKNDSKAIVFHIDLTRAHASGATITAPVTFRCYPGPGNKPEDAQAIARAIFDVLHQKGSGGIMVGYLSGGGTLPPEPDSGYNSYLAIYDITFSNT